MGREEIMVIPVDVFKKHNLKKKKKVCLKEMEKNKGKNIIKGKNV